MSYPTDHPDLGAHGLNRPTLGRYRLARHLGSGGMGEVYLAEDTTLERSVALKLLPKEVAEDASRRKRFLAEAKAASALNHPNVCTVYEVSETAEGQPFIAMEYLDGQPLNVLARRRRLELREIVAIGVQVADALEAARQQQIVHRDIKPHNVMVDARGRVKVLDFGIAKRLDQTREGAVQTQTGAMLGTPNYLSPEIALGREVDSRSDIFSLGVVLYELAAGKNPFAGATFGETVNNILNRAPEPLQPWNPGVTAEFERIVFRCLKKEPDKRYPTPGQLREDLARLQQHLQESSRPLARVAWGLVAVALILSLSGVVTVSLLRSKPGPPAPPPDVPAALSPKSVAVLLFANLSGDKAEEYLSEAFSEDLLNALGKVKGLRVPGRTSCFMFKGGDIRKIGKELGVGTLLEGSVRKAGTQLRVTAQLINVADGFQLWSDSYDRYMTNIFAIQSDIAARVAEVLKVQAPGAEPAASIEAYKLYAQGRSLLWNRRTVQDIRQAIEYFRQSTAVDPDYAPAHAGLANAYAVLPYFEVKSKSLESEAEAREAALKALQLQPRLAAAMATLAYCKSAYHWDWSGAEADFRRALELEPNYPIARQWYSEMLSTLGRPEEAIREASKAIEIDPLSPWAQAVYGRALIAAGRFDEAVTVLRKQIALDPSLPHSHVLVGYACFWQGRQVEAIAEFEAASRLFGGPEGHLGYAYAKAGRIDDAKRVLQRLLEDRAQGADASADLALVYHGLGDDQQAFEALERTAEEHAPWLTFQAVSHFWSDVRFHPRFQAILKKMNLVK